MEKRNQEPSVIITTYTCTSRHNSNNNSNSNSDLNGENKTASQISPENSADSTNLFSIHHNNYTTSHAPYLRTFHPTQNTSSSAIRQFALNQIKGPSGSVRGHKDVVKKSLENIKSVASSSQRNFTSSNLPSFMPTSNTNNITIQHMDEIHRIEYLNELIRGEQNQCVAYTTTLGVIRRTFEDSKLMR